MGPDGEPVACCVLHQQRDVVPDRAGHLGLGRPDGGGDDLLVQLRKPSRQASLNIGQCLILSALLHSPMLPHAARQGQRIREPAELSIHRPVGSH